MIEEESPKMKDDKKRSENSNPFLALFGFYEKEEKKDEKKAEKTKKQLKDNWMEKDYIRKSTLGDADGACYDVYDIYKKAHRMLST